MWLVGTTVVNGNLPFQLKPGESIVGRSPKAHVVIKDQTVSRRHARLICRGESLVVEDLRSRHGTFVNDEPAGQSPAQVGTRLRFGTVLCLLAPVAMYPADSSIGPIEKPDGRFLDGLTPAQHEVLKLVLQGLDEPSIAERLDRSGHTIHTHVKAIFKYLGVHSRAELLAKLLAGKNSGRLP